MAETAKKNELYTSADCNFKKLIKKALCSENGAGNPLNDSQILAKIHEMTNAVNDPLDNYFTTPKLFKDCTEGNFENVEEFIRRGGDINEIGPDGETALACAVNSNNFSVVELLLKSGANPNNSPEKNESTPLMDAFNFGYSEIARILLEFGADPDLKSSTNNSALHYAACGGHLDCLKLLLEYSSKPQALIEEQNENGHTALMEAATSGFLEIAKYLEQNGANVNTSSTEFKETALTLAGYKGYSEIVQYLLEAGADHEHRTDEMHTALMEASMEGHLDAAKVLLNHGANVNMCHDSFESPLTLAACSGHTDLSALLLAYGADIEEVNDESYSPLMEAAREGHLETIAMLLALGARINRVTEETQETAMTLAACGGLCEVVLLLQRCGADIELGTVSPLMEAAQKGHLEVVRALLVVGAAVDTRNADGETGLHLAAENGHVEVCRCLLEHGADMHLVSEGGKTCLMRACKGGHLDVVRLLVGRGARVDQMTITGDHTALSMACASGHCKVVEFLLEVGADPAVKLKDNCSVLIEASRAGHIDVIAVLLQDKNKEKRLLTAAHTVDPSCTIDLDIIGMQKPLNNHYTVSKGQDHLYDTGKKDIQQTIIDYSHFSSICEIDPQSCLLSSNESHPLKTEVVIQTEIPDPSLDIRPFSHYSSHSVEDVVSLPMSIFGSDNDKLLQNFLDSNSSNLQDWVKFMYPNVHSNGLNVTESSFNPLSTITVSQSEIYPLSTLQSQSQQTTNNNFHRMIKKAKHSENYNVQFDSICRHEFPNDSMTEILDSRDSCQFQRSPAEGSESVTNGDQFLFTENNDSDDETSNTICKDCNRFKLSNTSKDRFPNAFNYPIKNNIFSPLNKKISSHGLSLSESGVFSIEKSVNTGIQDVYQLDIKRISDSCSISQEPQVANIVTTTPLKKQVLQPRRRLQRSQQSLVSISSSLSASSSFCSEQIVSPQQITFSHQSEKFVVPSGSKKGTGFDSMVFTTQESSGSYNKFNVSNKNISAEESGFLFDQSLLGDLSRDHIHSKTNEYSSKYGLLSNNYHLDLISKLTVDNCDDLPNRKTTLEISSTNSTDNLEVVHEIANEDNDEDNGEDSNDFDSEIEIENCAPPYQSGVTSNGCCNRENCKKLNVNGCTELLQESPLSLACSGGHIEVVKLLVNSGAKLEHKDKKSQTALHVAVQNGHLEVVTFLLESGADIETMVDRTKDTALSIACTNGNVDIIEELVHKGANIEHKNLSDYTPLSLAALGGFVDAIKFLLKNNAEINSRTNSKLGISPLMLAAMNGHVDAVNVLLDNGSDINAQIETNRNTALTLACFQGRTEVVRLLVDKKAYVEHRAKSGLTPLMEAASQGHVEVGKILIAAGADVNAPPVPASRDTALIISAEKGHTDFLKLLLQYNAVVDARNKKGNTPLWLACNGGFLEVTKVLILAGADVNSADNRQMTCLEGAFKRGHVKVVRELIKSVTQFPSEHDCLKYLKCLKDKDMVSRCETCKDIILKAKSRQEYEAAKNAKDLLKQIEEERIAKEQKEVKQAKKREKKKAKKKVKNEEVPKNEGESISDENVPARDEAPLTISVAPSPEVMHLRSGNNNENIDPYNGTPARPSNKRARRKHDQNKSSKDIVMPLPPSDSRGNPKAVSCKPVTDETVTSGNGDWQKIGGGGGGRKRLDLRVGRRDIGKVIGQAGAVVAALRLISGAHIDIDAVAKDSEERTVHLRGSEEAVARARGLIGHLVDGTISGNAVVKETEPPPTSSLAVAVVKGPQSVSRAPPQSQSPLVTTSVAVVNGNLQYGFSKSMKGGSDFATVAAAGIVPPRPRPSLDTVTTHVNQAIVTSMVAMRSFPLAPGSERSLHQRRHMSPPGLLDDGGGHSHQQQPISDDRSQSYLDLLNRFPKLQTLNPKAEAFSPSSSCSTVVTHSNGTDFYYAATLNPTASVFQPRQTSITVTMATTTMATVSSSSSQQHSQPQEERLIRLQDYTSTAIDILLRTSGVDRPMAEAAFSSFMRSANLSLDTRLTTAQFTALISSVIGQSVHQSIPVANKRSQSSLSSSHWPSSSSSASLQSIWAPSCNGHHQQSSIVTDGTEVANGDSTINMPFFPTMTQCVSAQAAFNGGATI